jgi:hypothetical protein
MKCSSLFLLTIATGLVLAESVCAAGAFTPLFVPLTDHPAQIAVADVTGDSRNDIVLGTTFCGLDCGLVVLPQTDFGSIGAPVSYPAQQAKDVVVGDLNGDGRADVLVGGGRFLDFYFQNAAGVLVIGPGGGTFRPASAIAGGDFNHDGRTDLASSLALEEWPGPMTFDIQTQTAGGRFKRTSIAPESVDWCTDCPIEISDLDGDGRPDVYLVDDQGRLQVLYQKAGGAFVHQIIDFSAVDFRLSRVVPGNFDADPEPELFALGTYYDPLRPEPPRSPLSILDQTAPRQWTIRETIPLEVGLHRHEVADLNGDGRTDMVGITYPVLGTPQARIYLQRPNGALDLAQQFDLPYGNYFVGKPLAIADLDHDSLPDVAIASDNFGLIALMQQGDLPKAPPPELFPADIPDFGFTVRISAGSSTISGTLEQSCIAETACVSGAVQYRSEVFLRVVGPKGNGKLWPTIVKFTTSRVDVWVYQISTGKVRHYRLAGAAPGTDELPGLFDRNGFDPSPLSGKPVVEPTAGSAPPPPKRPIDWDRWGDFRFHARIRNGDVIQGVRREIACIDETLCLSGAIPGRSEVFVRLVGPKPNGKLWPTIVKFTTSTVEVWIEQISTGEKRYYRLEGATRGEDELTGLFDRNGFEP